jgi:hypothetical protein
MIPLYELIKIVKTQHWLLPMEVMMGMYKL